MARVYPISAAVLRKMWPTAKPAVIQGIVSAWPAIAAHYGFSSRVECAHAWGQFTWECSGGTELRENGHYSAPGIIRIFGVGHHSAAVTEAEAQELAAAAKTDGGRALFNRVYGLGNPKKAKELGNTGPDDGWLFRGAGALNTTGREAFGRVGKAIGQDLIGNPDLANDPAIALWMGAEEYVSLGCLKLAEADDTRAETVRINGGTNGLAGREKLIADWAAVFADIEPVEIGASVKPAPSPTKTADPVVAAKADVEPVGARVSPVHGAIWTAALATVYSLASHPEWLIAGAMLAATGFAAYQFLSKYRGA